MKHNYLFGRVAAVLFTVLMLLPQSAGAYETVSETRSFGPYGRGEVVTLPEGLSTRIFYSNIMPDTDRPGVAAINSKFLGQYSGEPYGRYQIGELLCGEREGGETHLIFSEYEWDESYDVTKRIDWDITITVTDEAYVEAGVFEPSNPHPMPNPQDLTELTQDTVLQIGDQMYNRVGLFYVSDCFVETVGDDKVLTRNSWASIYDFELTSSSPDVVQVDDQGYGTFQLTALKRGESTITVSVAAAAGFHNSKQVTYKVVVAGEPVDLYFYSIDNDTPWTSAVLESWGKYCASDCFDPLHTILMLVDKDGYAKDDLPVTITSSDESVATVELVNNREVNETQVGYGTAVFTAEFAGDDTYYPASAQFTVTYKDPQDIDLYFVDGEGNRIESLVITRQEDGTDDFSGTYPRLVCKQFGEELNVLYLNAEITSSDPNVATLSYSTTEAEFSFAGYGTTTITASVEASPGTWNAGTGSFQLTYAHPKQDISMSFSASGTDMLTSLDVTEDDCGNVAYPNLSVVMRTQDNQQVHLPINVTSSDESVLTINDASLEYISFIRRSYSTATITASFAGDSEYSPATASIQINILRNNSPLSAAHFEDGAGNTITELTIKEGETADMPVFVVDDGTTCYSKSIASPDPSGHFRWEWNSATSDYDLIYAVSAGEDTLRLTYWRPSSLGDIRTPSFNLKLPLHITPAVDPGTGGTYTVNVSEAGTFSIKAMLEFDNWTDPVSLTVNGPLNAKDLESFASLTNVETLNLSGAQISAMKGCSGLSKLREVVLPTSLQEIAGSAFYGCTALESINLDNITSIGGAAFSGCKALTSVALNNVAQMQYDAFYDCDGLTSISLPLCTTIGNMAFYDCDNLASATLPKCTILGNNAFYSCDKLSSVVLSDDLTYISQYCFYNCQLLTELQLPKSLQTIYRDAFFDVSIANVVLPKGIQTVETENFNRAVSLRLPATLTSFNYISSTWQRIYCYHIMPPTLGLESGSVVSGMTLYVPASSVAIYKADEKWKRFGQILPLDENIDEIQVESVSTLYSTAGLAAKTDLYIKAGGVFTTDVADNSTLSLGFYKQYAGATYSWTDAVDEGGNRLQDLEGNYLYKKSVNNTGVLYVKSPVTADSVQFVVTARSECWTFFSLPYNVKVQDIVAPENAQWVIREYSGAHRASGTGDTWLNVAADAVLQANKGYILYFKPATASVILPFIFPAADGTRQNIFSSADRQVSLAHFNAVSTPDKSWNLVGNPFPTLYDMRYTDFTGPVTVYVPRNNTYVAFSPLDDNYSFRPAESFFVQAPDGTDAITFRAGGRSKNLYSIVTAEEYANRSYYAAPSALARKSETESAREVYNFLVSDGDFSDRARVVFNEKAQTGYELGRDAAKMFSDGAMVPQLFVFDGDVQYAICERPENDGTLLLGIAVAKAGEYTLSLGSVAEAGDIILFDTETAQTFNLSEGGYTFTAEAGVNNSRFRVTIPRKSPAGVETVAQDGALVRIDGSSVDITTDTPVDITLYNIDGKMTGRYHSAALHLDLSSGAYILDIDGKVRKLIVK